MSENAASVDQLQRENEELRTQLAEAMETLRAISSGEVDALVISSEGSEQVFTLTGADEAYRLLIEEMGEGAATITAEGDILYANRRLAAMLKAPLEKVIGSTLVQWVAPADQRKLDALYAIDAPQRILIELDLVSGENASLPVQLSVNPLQMDGLPMQFCLVATDLTEQKKNAETRLTKELTDYTLAESERTRRALLSLLEDERQANAQIETQLRRLAALHMIDNAIVSTLRLPETLDVVLEQVITELDVDAATILLLNPSDQTLTYGAQRGFHTSMNQEIIIPVGQDFAGRAVNERRIVYFDSPDQIENQPFANFWSDEGFASYYGVPLIAKGEIKGVLEIFHRTAHPADDEWMGYLQTLAGQAAIAVENDALFTETERLLRQAQSQAQLTQDIIDSAPEGMLVLDSQHRLVLANPVARDYLPSLADVTVGEVLTSLGGKPLADFLGIFGKQQPWQEMSWGQPPRVYEVAAQPLSVGQQMSGWVMILRDITAEKDRQRYQQVQEQLATVGQMAAGIAHDFNNIMGAIVLYTQLLRNDSQLAPKHHKYVDVIHDQSRHAADLIRQILDFSRRAPMESAALDVVPLLKELIKLWERTLPENIYLELDYDRNECVVYGDPTRLQQVLMNLALNARDAMPQGGTLSFQLVTLSLAPGQVPPLPDMEPGEWLQLSVRDTGTGIAAEHLPHLFEPFFTTKQPGQGTGLGLAQVHGIIKQHDGSIAVESQPGRGTTFLIYLPIYNTDPAPTSAVVSQQTEQGAGEFILLVEDNEAMRMALADSLEGLGYRVFPAVDGIEALEILAQQTNGISLMLSDLVMPRMGGVELSHQARSRFPALKIIIMTGHPLHESEDELRQAGIEGWIRKPFSVSELTDQVQAVLGVRA